VKKPILNEISLIEVIEAKQAGKPLAIMTMSRGQWDQLLQGAYYAGWTLLEVDADEIPVKAYRKGPDS
jgi:hypothetical protein